MRLTIYHNPRCSKSRETLGLLEERGLQPEVVHYLETPPPAARIKELIELLAVAPMELVRTTEDEFAQTGLGPDSTIDQVAAAIAAHPKLLQRPIVVRGNRAALGRPPQNVLSLLEDLVSSRPPRGPRTGR